MTDPVYRLLITETHEDGYISEAFALRPVRTPAACKGLLTSYVTSTVWRNCHFSHQYAHGKVVKIQSKIQVADWSTYEDLPERVMNL